MQRRRFQKTALERTVVEVTKAMNRGKFALAERKAKQALSNAGADQKFEAHALLAKFYAKTMNVHEAVEHYQAAWEATVHPMCKLYCVAQMFNFLKVDPALARPGWWNDEDLLCLSARAVSEMPKSQAAWDMRAYVLVGQIDWPDKRERSRQDFEDAAVAFRTHATLNPERRDELLKNAVICEQQREQLRTGDAP